MICIISYDNRIFWLKCTDNRCLLNGPNRNVLGFFPSELVISNENILYVKIEFYSLFWSLFFLPNVKIQIIMIASYCQLCWKQNEHSMSVIQVHFYIGVFRTYSKCYTRCGSIIILFLQVLTYVILCRNSLFKSISSIQWDREYVFPTSYKTIRPVAIIYAYAGVNGVITGADFLLCFFRWWWLACNEIYLKSLSHIQFH